MPPSRTRKKKTPEPDEPSCSTTSNHVEENDEEDCIVEHEPKAPSTFSNKFVVLPKVYHNNFLYSVGDIISLRDENRVYYAQIRVIVEDNFSEKYVAVIWLLPTRNGAASKDFNPYTFTYGPQDEWFYNINEVSFVMHPPNKFFKRFIPPVPKNSDFTHVIKYKYKFKFTAKRKS